jgi:outer membrane receptor for ferrienterochelin and colicin
MNSTRRCLAVLGVALLLAPIALSQVPTAVLAGTVTQGGQQLPGVSVVVKSPALQGSRTTFTRANGDYLLPMLPPGEYTITFSVQGFETITRQVKLSAAQTSNVDAAMQISSVTATAVVVAERETISTTQQVATTLSAQTIEKLPVARTFQSAVLLTPGVANSGPAGNITISGAMSYENLFLVNGVAVNENLRGQPLDLFIEDAVQETTTTTAGISAEYGRFQGGVVNVVTKSGGNDFSGSFRASLANDDWSAVRAYRSPGGAPETLVDKTNPTYEGTLGGPIWQDRIWFFLAGRFAKTDFSRSTASPLNLPFTENRDQKRFEGKLTISPFERHTLLASYQKIEDAQNNNWYTSAPIYDYDSLYNRETPQELLSVNYNATITNSLFAEAQYSQRKFTFVGSGSQYTDLIKGTLLLDLANGSTRYWSPTFCGVCDDEKRDNEDVLLKATYFLSTAGTGSHNLVFGADRYSDKRFANNHQSGSDYRIYTTGTVIRDNVVYPRITGSATGNSPTYIMWNPIDEGSRGNDFRTWSVFVNDSWHLNNLLSISLGVRWDKNDGANQSGVTVVNDDKFSPRLGIAYDVKGDGGLIATASWARYVAAIANNQADTGARGGNPSTINFDYRGPSINADASAPTSSLVPTADALAMFWDWFFANGGTSRPIRGTPSISGLNPTVGEGLASPATDEFSIGLSKRIGVRGLVRVDGVYRTGGDFYGQKTDMTTGTVTGSIGGVTRVLDKSIIVNTDLEERTYVGLNLQVSYRALDRLNLGGNYTWSHAYGTFDGETTTGGPATSGIDSYPEYRDVAWYAPVGDLSVDRRHRVRLFGTYDIPSPASWLTWSLGAVYQYTTGLPYGAVGTVDSRDYVTNPGYKTPPSTVTYYFTSRDEFRTDGQQGLDLSLNLGLRPWKDVEIFLQPQVVNVFNSQSIVDVRYLNTTVYRFSNPGPGTNNWAKFNPFTEAPVRGANGSGAHWNYGPDFGKPTSALAYQQARTWRVSVGVRF